MLIPILTPIAVLLIAGCALWYILRQKKRGARCIGCPYAKSCTACRCHTSHLPKASCEELSDR